MYYYLEIVPVSWCSCGNMIRRGCSLCI